MLYGCLHADCVNAQFGEGTGERLAALSLLSLDVEFHPAT